MEGRWNRRYDWQYDRIPSGCGLAAIISEAGRSFGGEEIIQSICVLHDRSNGLGGGFAGYGIYPEKRDLFAFHVMFESIEAKELVDAYFDRNFYVEESGHIPTRKIKEITNAPLLWRYFVKPLDDSLQDCELCEEDFVTRSVFHINGEIPGAYVFSSGKNMGAFKAVGYPEDVGRFYRLDEYEGYSWIGHGRFPTNTPGWWGGAHPFTLLDWSLVHNGEISSYGINKRYLEMFGYRCELQTDTEVAAYLFDLLLRRHGLSIEVACKALASPFWSDIDRMPEEERELFKAIRMVYGPALLNGPFAIVLGFTGGLIGINDRVKLRPLVAARKDDRLYLASEEAAIREISPDLDVVWAPKAGEPVIGRVRTGEPEVVGAEETVA
ncbi:MAG: glutamine amidotransferase family protein [Actinobacteria bacterium]|nr:glutamine amidotransferase family protein [Actinomycetota bacterium]